MKGGLKRVSIRVPAERAEKARAAWLERFPEGFEEVDLGGEIELAAYTDHEAPPGARVEDVDAGWEDRWREFHRPVRVGPLWIGPPWERPPGDVVPLVIDPGRAFGTGAHATTRLCLELVAEIEPQSILDIGCGSGVVAIAAAVLDFAPVVAVDVDPAAVEAATCNAARNGVGLDVRELDALTAPLPSAAVIVANLTLVLVESLIARVSAQTVVTSGYLESDAPRLGPYDRIARRARGGWAADLLERAQ